MKRARARFLGVVSSVALIASGLITGATAAQAATMDISSAGPLTHIYVSDTLGCQVAHTGDSSFEWYSPGSVEADCGTSMYIGPSDGTGTVFGAATIVKDQTWTPVSQSAVTGTGTSGDPLTVVTVVDAGDTGIRLTQTDTYVLGEESYRTDVRINNTTNSAIDGVLYRLGDCYLGGSDSGYGIHDTASGAVGCRASQAADSRVEEWVPITAGSNYYESGYSSVVTWPASSPGGKGKPFPDTSDDNTSQDNGTGISWTVHVPANGHSTFSELSAFSPTGNVPLSTSKTVDNDTVPPDSSDGYTITVHNPNASGVTLNDVTDNLPSGFDYVNGSTTNAAPPNDPIADPTVESGGDLTWNGPFTVPAGGDFSLHFGIVASSTPGNYNNQAGADAANNYSVAPTGPTAQVHVTSNGISVTKTDAPDPVTAGDNVAYTAHVTNHGPDPATGVFLDDSVPSDATFVSASGTGWTCDSEPSEGHLTCDGPNLGVGESSDVTLVVTTTNPPPEGGTITNSVTVTDNEGGSASDSQTTTVVPKDPDHASGYIPPEGGTVTTGKKTTADDPTNASATLPPGGPGGVVTLDEQPAAANFCGGTNCRGDAVIITIPDGYRDPSSPPKLRLTYDVTISSGAARIWVQEGTETPVRVPLCLQHRVANPSPCIGRRTHLPNFDQRVNILLLSGDPIFGKH
jgi:uncharacterized repeat protein (TIGR01451 family)